MRVCSGDGTPFDYCDDCADEIVPTEEDAREVHGAGEDPFDGRGNLFAYDVEHPDYEEDGYRCARCGKKMVWPSLSGLLAAVRRLGDDETYSTW